MNLALIGLEQAQKEYVRTKNESLRHPGMTPEDRDWNRIGAGIEEYTTETIKRYQAGERLVVDGEAIVSIQDTDIAIEDRLLCIISGPDSIWGSAQEQNLTLTFPLLLQTMAEIMKLSPLDVSVSAFENCRENGLVYSVIQPDGQVRSFCLYEHRNSDSIIINGNTTANGDTKWDNDGDDLPYAGNKYEYFAEISYGGYQQAADTLLFFLHQAAQGQLDDDATLVEKCEHLDWNAILSKQIPGYAQWAASHGYKPMDRFAAE